MCELKEIPDYEDYLAGEDGNIYSKRTGKPMYMYLHKLHGRYHVQLYKNGKRKTLAVHVLIAKAFHGKRTHYKHEVSHLNGNCTDNRPVNLIWETHKKNMWRREGKRLTYIRV